MVDETLYRKPNWTYVSQRLNEYKWELMGAHTKIDELEKLKYYEDDPQIKPEERNSGQSVKSGLTADLIEQVKAAILANPPKVHGEAFRKHQDADSNLSKREKFLQADLDSMMSPTNIVAEVIDSVLLGYGVLKAGRDMSRWDTQSRRRKRGEDPGDYIDRVDAYKKLWGPPISKYQPNALALFFRGGVSGKPDEIIELSYKPKPKVLKDYDLTNTKPIPSSIANVAGQPDQYVKALPSGVDTTNYILVTEYWNPDWYQVYGPGGELIFEESPPTACYFLAAGRSSSSKDPDKFAISIADNLRYNEPKINRFMTRMVEAADLLVNKRLTLEVPDGYVPEVETTGDEEATTGPKTWTFRDDYTEALPAGSKVVDPYAGVEAIYEAMPALQLLLQIVERQGVSPLFKGISPGAAGSGYRDNSLYIMARSAFDYIIKSIEAMLSEYLNWVEWLVADSIKQEIFIGELSLKPSDIKDWPAKFRVELKPAIPQNLVAEGEFWERQREAGNVTRRFVRERGLGLEQPDEMQDEMEVEELYEMLKPVLYADVVNTVMARGPLAQQQQSGLVDPSGNPISSGGQDGGGMDSGGIAAAMRQPHSTTTTGRGGQASGGFATQGQPKRPSIQPASTNGVQP